MTVPTASLAEARIPGRRGPGSPTPARGRRRGSPRRSTSQGAPSTRNAGATFVPHSQDEFGDRASATGYNLGQSFIWLAHPRFNFMLETVFASSQSVVARDKTEWSNSLYLSPGIRWSHNFKNGLQIVPGIGVPLGVGPSGSEKGVFLYLSFEHPFRKIPKK